LFFDNIYVSPEVADNPLVKAAIERIPHNSVKPATGENHPGNGLLLTVNRGSFLKPCPGQKGNICCGYWVVEWGMGCPFRCEYCVLQYYIKPGDVTWFLNWEDCLREVSDLRIRTKGNLRIGTGEFGDSLALEEFFPLNSALIDFTSSMPGVTIEVKTKSDKISNLENIKNRKHVIVAFSLNVNEVTQNIEHGTASLKDRLKSAVQIARWGYKPAFHFDPLIPVKNWKEKYQNVIDMLGENFSDIPVAWISLGSFRFPKAFQEAAEFSYPNSTIFREEFYPCDDGKMRYFRPLREEMYGFMLKNLKAVFGKTKVYICMESPDVWERVTGDRWNSLELKMYLDEWS